MRHATIILRTTLPLLLVTLGSLLLLPGVAGGLCEEIDPIDLRPEDGVCGGWVRDGEPQTAHTPEELQAIINGGYLIYVNHGFIAAVFQNYLIEIGGGPAPATLSVFNQGTPENAQGLFYDPEIMIGEPVPDWPYGGEARVHAAFGVVTFQFWEECFFGSIVLISGEAAAVDEAACMAGEVAALIEGAVPVASESWGRIKATFR